MPMIEIDETEVQRLKGLEKLLNNMGSNPKTRAKALEIIQELSGGQVAIPELETKKQTAAEIAALQKRIDDMQAASEKEKAEARKRAAMQGVESQINSGRKLLSERKFTADGIAAVEKLMEERGITDYEAAAALFEKQSPPESPVTPTGGGRSWDFTRPQDKDDDHKSLLANPDSWAHGQVGKVLAEFRQRH